VNIIGAAAVLPEASTTFAAAIVNVSAATTVGTPANVIVNVSAYPPTAPTAAIVDVSNECALNTKLARVTFETSTFSLNLIVIVSAAA